MDDNNKYTIQDLIMSALDQKPDDFAQGFNTLMVDRLNVAVADRKNEIAQSMFEDPNDEDIEDQQDSEEQGELEFPDADEETDLNPEE